MSFSEVTHFREEKDLDEQIRKFSASSGDEAFEKLELRRRLTIVAPTPIPILGDDEEALDIGYDDELIYDDQDEVGEVDDFYERYSDEEQLDDNLREDDEIPTPQTFEELNALYKPKFEEKLTKIEPRVSPMVEMLSPISNNTVAPRNTSPQPPPPSIMDSSSGPDQENISENPSSPSVPRNSSPIPTEKQEKHDGPLEDEYDDEDEYSDEMYEEDELESDVDDEELMKRLEAKYGKLPQPVDVEDEEDYLDESEDEDDPSWTSKVK